MVAIRVRHPKGVSTLELDLDNASVADLQASIFSISEIQPSNQQIKSGYPPRPLTIIPELPLASLGITRGEQIIVTDSSSSSASQPPPPAREVKPAPTIPAANLNAPHPDFVQTDTVAIAFTQDMANARAVRNLAADAISSDPETYNEAILGMPPAQYIAKIRQANTWGGAIELAALARHFGAEIASIDVETGRVDSFTPQGGADTRCILIYSGIHYDAASLAPSLDAPTEWHQTVFPIQSQGDSDAILAAAKKLAGILRGKKAFTNTATFDLKCELCGQGLKGEKEARAHAEQTGHTRFGEY